MYHKVNDIPDNPTTVPVARFDEQLAQLRELGYQVVDLDAVLEYYAHGVPLPPRAVLITFDDGYRDTLENALPVLARHGEPAVIFVPVAYMEDEMPLPHETRLVERGMRNPTLDWGLMRELDAGGVRVESHGIAHRPLAEIELDEAVREIAVSKLKLEEQLGRPVRAYAYVKGSEAHFHPVHESIVKQAGYEVAFTTISRLERRRNRTRSGSALQRRAVPGAHVRARARGRLRPDRLEGHRRRHARAAPVQPGARHLHRK